MRNEQGVIKRLIDYWLGPERTSENLLSSVAIGSAAAAKLEELRSQLNPPSNTSQ